MKTKIPVLAVLLTAGSVWAQTTSTVTATDGTTSATYGVCNGFLIDFNANSGTRAPWTPSLVGNQQYSLNSISIELGAANSSTEYLGVYSGNVGGVAGTGQGFNLGSLTFLGTSQNAINFSTVTLDTWLTYNFSGINVTADAVTPSTFTGSGTLLFVYQPIPTAETSWPTTVSTLRFNTGLSTIAADSLSEIYGNNNWVSQRAPQYEASVTVAPEPSTLALGGFSGLAFLMAILRQKKFKYFPETTFVSGFAYSSG